MDKELEPILNWSNNLNNNNKEQGDRIAKIFAEKLNSGFSIDDTMNILIGSGEPYTLILPIANHYKKAQKIEINLDTEITFPESYDDVKHIIVSMIENGEINNYLNENPLINSDNKSALCYLVKYASEKINNKQQINKIHSILRPYITEMISDTKVLTSDAMKNQTLAFKKNGENQFLVKDEAEVYDVNIKEITCSCPRFKMGGMQKLGMACEHILESIRFSKN